MQFPDALEQRVLVCDGAMGTMLYAKGVFINKSFDALNLTQPDLVDGRAPGVRARRRRHHRDQHIRRQPHQARVVRSGRQAARHQRRGRADRARRAAGDARLRRRRRSARSASASSRGARPASTRRASTSASRRRRSLEGGVDLFILETFRDLNEIGAAIDAVRSRVATCRSSRR